MKTTIQTAAICVSALLLSACGGSGGDAGAPQNKLLSSSVSLVTPPAIPPEQYTDVVQQIYMAFLGRPADAVGLGFWAQAFADRRAPTTIAGFISAYPTDASTKNLVDNFVNSAESLSLYTGNNAAFINAVYLNAFNRNAEIAGRDFWSGFLDRGQISRAQAAMWILAGAQNDDAIVAAKRIQAATYFTAALDNATKILRYSGPITNQAARELLGTITATTDMEAFKSTITAFIAALEGEPSPFPAIVYFAGFNFLQQLGNAPSYSARYAYRSTYSAPQVLPGTLTFGEVPQTITWTREGTSYSFAAPYSANVALGRRDITPSIAMLCRPLGTAEGGSPESLKSTDVLVAASAKRLVDAAQLAGQTLATFHENCEAGAAGEYFAFDKLGNATFNTAGGAVSFDAATVTAALNGQVVFQTADNQSFAFAAYSYLRADGTSAYAIVQQQKITGETSLPNGSLAVWSQE